MFGGIPLAFWILFGFAHGTQRTTKYETMLRGINLSDELEDVARQWEYSLMLRLLGRTKAFGSSDFGQNWMTGLNPKTKDYLRLKRIMLIYSPC